MNCECNNKSNRVKPGIKHVYGNVLRMAIPLTLRTLVKDGDEMVVTDTDFIPSSDHPVRVVFSKGKTNYPIIATMDGNVAIVEDKGKIPVGTYDISVECYDDLGNPYRFKQNAVLYVADTTSEAGIDEEIEYEAQTWYLNAAVFLATTEIGEIGDAIDAKLDDVFGNVAYDANAKEIRFYNKDNSRVLATIDSRPFIADGTVADVYIDVGRQVLVVVLNEDAGGTRFSVPLYLVFAEYYKKDEVDSLVSSTVEGLRFDFSQELPLVVHVTKNGSSYSSPVDFGSIENAIREDGRLVVACVNNVIFYQLLVADRAEIAFSRVVALDGYQELLIVDPHNVWSMEDVDLGTGGGGGYEPPAGGIPKSDLAQSVQDTLDDVDNKVDKETGKGLSTNDYTTAEKTKLAGIDPSTYATKTEVNAKQDTINDLDAIRSGASLGATALQSYTETDPTVPAWAKQSTKPSYTASEVGAVPTTRTVNGKALNNNITLSQSDIPGLVAALAAKVGYSDDEWLQVKAGAIQATTAVQDTTTVNGKRLNNNIVIGMDDIPGLAEAISEAGEVKSVTINGTNHTPDSSGIIDLGTIQGAQGPKGDTGNVQVDGNGNVLIVNNLEEGGTGAALSAEMGKRLALLAGTYAEAWARSKVITVPFCWLWVETVNGAAISKPIWHKGNSVFVDAAGAIINVTAAAVPNAPTITGATSGSTVPKNTQITITPASGSALYYSIDGGSTYHVSDNVVTLTLATAGSVSIVAYCANNAGNSSNATLSVTVAGTAVPVFSPSQGEVARGGNVTISVPSGGELHYKVGEGSWQTASGNSVSIPITGETTIEAYNVEDGDTSNTVSNTYTMATLAAPTMTMSDTTGTANQFPDGGGTVSLDASAGTIYYTTDDSTPTTSSTQYSQPIQVTSAMTIKAIAVDEYGSSAVTENAYTVLVVPKFRFKVKLNGDSAVTVGAPFLSDGSIKYTCVVDWGDGSTTTLNNQYASGALCNHSYSYPFTDNVDEDGNVTITIKPNGNSLVVPNIDFENGLINTNGVSRVCKILENSLTCDSQVKLAGVNLEYISADAYSNNTLRQATFKGIGSNLSTPTECESGLFANLTTSANGLSSCANMFQKAKISLTEQHMNHLKGVIGNVTVFNRAFNDFTGICAIPDDFFGNIADGTVTSFAYMTNTSTVTGDAGKLYNGDSSVPYSGMKDLLASGGAYIMALAGPNLTNKTSVPNAWKQ